MIIAIDGPAGVGKSTVARRVAEKTGYFFLNSGNFYRAITLLGIESGLIVEGIITDTEKLLQTARACDISISKNRLFLDNRDVEDLLHTDDVDSMVAQVSAIIELRHVVNELLRKTVAAMDIVTEGRDMTTVVFPGAEVKIYLDADIHTRSVRRHNQGVSSLSVAEIESSIKKRDNIDKNKEFGKLEVAPDALYINTSGLTIDQVCEKVFDKIKQTSVGP